MTKNAAVLNATLLGCSITCKDVEASIRWYHEVNVAGYADVDSAAARIKAAGGTLLNEPDDRPWGVRMFQLKDLDGFKLGVSTPLKG